MWTIVPDKTPRPVTKVGKLDTRPGLGSDGPTVRAVGYPGHDLQEVLAAAISSKIPTVELDVELDHAAVDLVLTKITSSSVALAHGPNCAAFPEPGRFPRIPYSVYPPDIMTFTNPGPVLIPYSRRIASG